MNRVHLTAAAEADLTAALEWYDARMPGLGARLLDEYKAVVSRLADNPQQFPIVRGQVRRAAFHRFPYGMFFRIREDRVEVFACFHARRDPARWQRWS